MKKMIVMLLVLQGQWAEGKNKTHPIVTSQGAYLVEVTPHEAINTTSVNLRTTPQVLESGAIHIAAQQCPDGGFGWPHNDCSSTFHNITPPIIDGVRQAYNLAQNGGYLGVMINGGEFDLLNEYDNGEKRLGAFTAYQMWNLSHDSGNSIYRDFTETEFFAPLEAGTYGTDDLNTEGWIAAVETNRTGAWVNLRPWEFSSLILMAQRHCRDIQSGMFEQGIIRGLGTLDNTNPDNVYSDVIGLSGGLLGLARVNRMSFPAINAPSHTGVSGLSSLEQLSDYLVSLQNPDGSFYWHSNLVAPEDNDKDTQTTAYAVMALIKAQERLVNGNFMPAILAGQAWLASMQDEVGGFASFPGDIEHNTEVEGEALTALGTTGVFDRIYQSGLECYVN